MLRRLLMLLVVAGTCGFAWGNNWPHWRGPFYNGSTDETGLPQTWSRTEGVVWSAELPGASAATPIVWEDHVFVSTADPASDMLKAMCFDRRSGRLLWQHDIAKGIRKDYRSTFAAPSPTTDGQLVAFFYGNGDLVAFDFDGKRLWSRNIQKDYGPFAFLWTFSSSPLLYGGKLYLQVLQRDVPVRGSGLAGRNDSYLLAMDPKTGKTLWKQIRPSQAREESREAFSSPVPFTWQGRSLLLVAGGDDLTAHDAATGRELWRWGTWNPDRIGHWRLVPSPVASRDVVLVCAPKREPVYAIRAGGTGRLDDRAIAWTGDRVRALSSDVPTPAYYDGDFFILSDVTRSLSRVEPATGRVKWTISTPGRAKYEASPLVADGKVYLINFDGEVAVVDADDGTLLRVIPMEDGGRREEVVRSSIAAAHGQLFIRTTRKLYCIGQP